MPQAKINGVNLYYQVEGEGEPVLFIMGTGLTHALWTRQIDAFKGKYKCISYDNRGTGETDRTKEGHTVANYAEDAAGLLDHLGIASAHVAGWSLGSCIGQELAIHHPDKVRSLILIATWCKPYPFLRRRFEVQIEIAKLGNQRLLGEYSVLHLFRADHLDEHDEEVLQFQRRSLEGPGRSPMETMIAHYRMDIEHDTADRLAQIKVPTLVLGGQDDALIRAPYQEEVHRRIPGAEINLISKADHMALALMPDRVNRIALDFLERHFGTQARSNARAS
jgi:pimeloyl-ACP methyl ester carboxylesterase